MFFSREGNKSKYSSEIIKYFPPHKCYVEGFVGVGGIFFNKPLAKYNILNDSSQFVYSIYEYLKDEAKYEEMLKIIEFTPNYFDYIKNNVDEPIKTILLHQYSFLKGGQTQKLGMRSEKITLLNKIKSLKNHFLNYTKNAMIVNKDIFKFLKSISTYEQNDYYFIYLDPPYSISKGNLKDNKGWTFEKLEELIILLHSMNVMYAISEFNDLQVLELFKKYNLCIKTISKSRFNKTTDKYEILAMNYNLDEGQVHFEF